MNVLTGNQYEQIVLSELAEAREEVRKAIIAGLYPWTSVGRRYAAAAERQAREAVRSLQQELAHLRARQASPVPPPKPAQPAPVQLELFAGMPPLPARGPPRRRRARR